VYFARGEVLTPLGYDLAYRDHNLCYARLIPRTALGTPIELATLKDVVLGAPLLTDRAYSSVLPGLNRYGAITCILSGSNLSASTQLFQNGEIWCISAALVRTERDEVPQYVQLPCLSAFVLEQNYYTTIWTLVEFATTKLCLNPPWNVELGLTGVNGLYFNWDRNQIGPVHKTEVVHRSVAGDIKVQTLDDLLLSFFARFSIP